MVAAFVCVNYFQTLHERLYEDLVNGIEIRRQALSGNYPMVSPIGNASDSFGIRVEGVGLSEEL